MAAIREVLSNKADYFRIEGDGKLISENFKCQSLCVNNV